MSCVQISVKLWIWAIKSVSKRWKKILKFGTVLILAYFKDLLRAAISVLACATYRVLRDKLHARKVAACNIPRKCKIIAGQV